MKQFLLIIILSLFTGLRGIAQNVAMNNSGPQITNLQMQSLNSDSAESSDWSKMTNVFTPNGDGINDYFTLHTIEGGRYKLFVYTRSGVLVYSSESPKIFWDGRSLSGIEMRQGIYYYVVEGREGGKAITRKGFVHLFR